MDAWLAGPHDARIKMKAVGTCGSDAHYPKEQCVSHKCWCTVYTLVAAEVGPETHILVMGAGPIGLVTMLAARSFGVPRIVIVDVDDNRLTVAKQLGADGIVKVTTSLKVSTLS
ncbi:hypothetical protein HID58_009470 [Brassica napus]|uniref:Uncharacterized protein n=1 Tax=Brassica napus TaxID=3708 RepID=A0ABQ8DSQ7_BRANA|nr:hypothetical protein HID58_009470 [Brassica napus]